MTKSALPRSVRKFIRTQKARIRREVSDAAEAERSIRELVAKALVPYAQKEAFKNKS